MGEGYKVQDPRLTLLSYMGGSEGSASSLRRCKKSRNQIGVTPLVADLNSGGENDYQAMRAASACSWTPCGPWWFLHGAVNVREWQTLTYASSKAHSAAKLQPVKSESAEALGLSLLCLRRVALSTYWFLFDFLSSSTESPYHPYK